MGRKNRKFVEDNPMNTHVQFGFNVRADAMARKTADKEGVRIEYYSIIYNLIQRLR
jgi:translation initiation factor IF-2